MDAIKRKSKRSQLPIVLTSSKIMRIVTQEEILYLKSDNCYTLVYLIDNSKFLACKTLKIFETELNSDNFIRCHKSFIVNKRFIKELTFICGEYLVLISGDKIPISRRKLLETKQSLMVHHNRS